MYLSVYYLSLYVYEHTDSTVALWYVTKNVVNVFCKRIVRELQISNNILLLQYTKDYRQRPMVIWLL